MNLRLHRSERIARRVAYVAVLMLVLVALAAFARNT